MKITIPMTVTVMMTMKMTLCKNLNFNYYVKVLTYLFKRHVEILIHVSGQVADEERVIDHEA